MKQLKQRNPALILTTILTRKENKLSKRILLRSIQARVYAFSANEIVNRLHAGNIRINLSTPELNESAEITLVIVGSRTRTLAENATIRSLSTSADVSRFVIRSHTAAVESGMKQLSARNHLGRTQNLVQRRGQQIILPKQGSLVNWGDIFIS